VENKGEVLGIEIGKIPYNELMYATVHELAHIFNDEIGHGDKFIGLNQKLLRIAVSCGIYKYVDYTKKPFYYNGILVNQNIIA
jgi:hypothetical protein